MQSRRAAARAPRGRPTLISPSRALRRRRQRLDFPDRGRIVVQEFGWNQPGHEIHPPSIAGEDLSEDRRRLRVPPQLPEGRRLPK
jgi:hypothetical protein